MIDFYICHEKYHQLPGLYGQLLQLDPYLHPAPCEYSEEVAELLNAATAEILRTWGGNHIPIAAHDLLYHAQVWGWIPEEPAA